MLLKSPPYNYLGICRPKTAGLLSELPQVVGVRVVEEVEAQGQILSLELLRERGEGARLVNAADGSAVQRGVARGADHRHSGDLPGFQNVELNRNLAPFHEGRAG